MKRKRFIKLMMGRGVQRNDAEMLAARVCRWKSYKNTYTCYAAMSVITTAFAFVSRRLCQTEEISEQQYEMFLQTFRVEEKDGASHA